MIHSKWQSSCGNYKAVISQEFYNQIKYHAISHFPDEVGSCVVGSYSEDNSTVNVLRPTSIQMDDGLTSSFTRGTTGLGSFFRKLWDDTDGEEFYVGEWHTHPGGCPFPSSVDSDSMFYLARDPLTACATCLLIILAFHETYEELGLYIYTREGSKIPLTRL